MHSKLTNTKIVKPLVIRNNFHLKLIVIQGKFFEIVKHLLGNYFIKNKHSQAILLNVSF